MKATMASVEGKPLSRCLGTLAPTFRSSCTASAPTFHELRKVMGTSKQNRVPLVHLKFLDEVRRLWCRNFKWAAHYPLALLFLATGLAAFFAEVLAVTGARALEVASDFGLAADFFAATFFAGLAAGASASDFAVSLAASLAVPAFVALAGFAAFLPRLEPPLLAARSSISAIASASVIASLSLSLGIVALT